MLRHRDVDLSTDQFHYSASVVAVAIHIVFCTPFAYKLGRAVGVPIDTRIKTSHLRFLFLKVQSLLATVETRTQR